MKILGNFKGRFQTTKAGMAPGTLVYTGKQQEKPVITVIDYNKDYIEETELTDISQAAKYKDSNTVTWINITGLSEIDIIEQAGQLFDIHPLVLEDILHINQRPKFENYEDYLFIVLKMLDLDGGSLRINSEQVSFIVGKNFVITFQETPADVFDAVRNRIRTSKGRIRNAASDYLAYALIDAVVDNYFVILEALGEQIEEIENQLLDQPHQELLQQIHLIKREMILVRRSIWPLREVINGLTRSESRLIEKSTKIYIRDLYDHTIQVIDTVESFRDIVSGMLDTYLSAISNKMNSIMKVLTIIATIFIPLTFVAGIYGMNFEYMPELQQKWAYPAILILMLLAALAMLAYFRKKDWL